MSEYQQIIKDIIRYQENIEKYLKKKNYDKVLHYIGRLNKLSVKVVHLKATGVGKTINCLRKYKGSIGDAAKKLVSKWKKMVVSEECESEQDNSNDTKQGSETGEEESSDYNPPQSKRSKESSNEYKEHSATINKDYAYSRNEDHRVDQSDEGHFSDSNDEMGICTQEELEAALSDKEIEFQPKRSKHERSPSSKYSRNKSSNGDEKSNNRKSIEKCNKTKNSSRIEKESSTAEDDESDSEATQLKKKNIDHKSSKSKSTRKDSEDDRPKYDHNKENAKKREKQKTEKLSSPRKRHRSSSTESEPAREKKKSRSSSHKSEHTKSSHSKCESSPNIEVKQKREHKSKEHSKDKTSPSKVEKSSKELKKSSSKHVSKKNVKDDSKERKVKDSDKSRTDKKDKKKRFDSSQKTAFENAVAMCEPALLTKSHNKKKLQTEEVAGCSKFYDDDESSTEIPALLKDKPQSDEPLIDVNLSTLLPAITPNYRPMGNATMDFFQKKNLSEEEALSRVIYAKNRRTKVFSGNKTAWSVVPTLFELCTRILQDNIDALKYTGGVPYLILKPILEKATASQLFQMEHYNSYLTLETDELWKLHVQKEFKNKTREELETWREMYMRCVDEREAKLRALTANIKQAQDKSLPVRTTKMAYIDDYVKPPRNIAKKQAKNGTAYDKKPTVTPSSRLANLSSGSSGSALGDSGRAVVPNPGHRAVERSHTLKIKPKKAPLMAKTLSFLKNRFRR